MALYSQWRMPLSFGLHSARALANLSWLGLSRGSPVRRRSYDCDWRTWVPRRGCRTRLCSPSSVRSLCRRPTVGTYWRKEGKGSLLLSWLARLCYYLVDVNNWAGILWLVASDFGAPVKPIEQPYRNSIHPESRLHLGRPAWPWYRSAGLHGTRSTGHKCLCFRKAHPGNRPENRNPRANCQNWPWPCAHGRPTPCLLHRSTFLRWETHHGQRNWRHANPASFPGGACPWRSKTNQCHRKERPRPAHRSADGAVYFSGTNHVNVWPRRRTRYRGVPPRRAPNSKPLELVVDPLRISRRSVRKGLGTRLRVECRNHSRRCHI